MDNDNRPGEPLAYTDVSMLGFLATQTRRGMALFDPSVRRLHTEAVLRFYDRRNGAFTGRRGGADLYYTAFATRSLHALGYLSRPGKSPDDSAPRSETAVDQELAEQIARSHPDLPDPPHLRQALIGYALSHPAPDIMEVVNAMTILHLLRGPVRPVPEYLKTLERQRTGDGGYAARPGRDQCAVYHCFLAVLCYDMVGLTPPEKPELIEAILSRRQADGGFSDGARENLLSAGVNPTAAGFSALAILEALDDEQIDRVCAYLFKAADPSGGWRAAPSAPAPDLLSAFTALVTLQSAGRLDRETMARAVKYLKTCQIRDGGFSAGPYDRGCDVEYTSYGLGLLAMARLLSPGSSPKAPSGD